MEGIRVTVWNEGVHEKTSQQVRTIYPNGLGRALASHIEKQPEVASVHLSELDHEGQGLTSDILDNTNVLVWWGHLAHDDVTDDNAAYVHQRVLDGMGLLVLHSGHLSKPFVRLMGTSCRLKWRVANERERLWVVDPAHPIAHGLPECFVNEPCEMYGEHFDIPQPDQLVLVSWFTGGEVFRSGCCWHRGKGKVFYFRPGHETCPVYHNEHVLKVISNGVKWLAPTSAHGLTYGNAQALEGRG